jgi:hypothetical protein
MGTAVVAAGSGVDRGSRLSHFNPFKRSIRTMTIRKILMAALMAAGFGTGMAAQAFSTGMHDCCTGMQLDCEATAPFPAMCDGVYERCMLSRRCIPN